MTHLKKNAWNVFVVGDYLLILAQRTSLELNPSVYSGKYLCHLLSHFKTLHFNHGKWFHSNPDGASARGGPWPPPQYASRSLGSLLCLSIRLYPSFSGPWTRHPAILFLVFLFVLLHTAFRTASFFGIAVSCILSICPSHRILWHLINLTVFFPLIMASNSSFCRVLHNSFTESGCFHINSQNKQRLIS